MYDRLQSNLQVLWSTSDIYSFNYVMSGDIIIYYIYITIT